MMLRTVCRVISPVSMSCSQKVGRYSTARQGHPNLFVVKNNTISVSGGGEALDTSCYIADSNDDCNICKSCVSGQAMVSFHPSETSYVYGLYSDVEFYACESCVLSMFKAVRQLKKD